MQIFIKAFRTAQSHRIFKSNSNFTISSLVVLVIADYFYIVKIEFVSFDSVVKRLTSYCRIYIISIVYLF